MKTPNSPETDHRSPPPPAEACLCSPYPSSQKGGTVIAEHVTDLKMHEQLLGNGGYRPSACPRCGDVMHIHEYRERVLAGSPELSTEIVIFQCADRERCGAVTRVLPAFLARRLWRSWRAVEAATLGPEKAPPISPIPERTRRRWKARLAASAAVLVVVLGTAADTVPVFQEIIGRVGLDGTRAEFVTACEELGRPAPSKGSRLATISAFVHRLAPGVRLM